jgi:two-component system CheB/CheR fusion protein
MGVRIAGLGASAGGLDPLVQFLANVPVASGLAYLVVQHMDPTHETLLRELLQRATLIPVHEAVDGQRIEPNTAYVITPDTELTVQGGALHLAKPGEPRGQRCPSTCCSVHWRANLAKEPSAWCCRAWDRTARWDCRRSRRRAA